MREKEQIQEWVWVFLWGVTLVSLLGSLFYSEILGYVPCQLCWIQRIFMYPLVVIYGVSMLQKSLSVALPGLILSCLGLCISTVHYLMQKLPSMQRVGSMCSDVPCNVQYVNYLGFVTIPFLAGMAFLLIIISHLFLMKYMRRSTNA